MKRLPKRLEQRLSAASAAIDAAIDRLRAATIAAEDWTVDVDAETSYLDDGMAHLWHIIGQLDEHIDDVGLTLDDVLR